MAPKSLSIAAFKTYQCHSTSSIKSPSSGKPKVVGRNKEESPSLGAKTVNGEEEEGKLMHTGEGAAVLRCFGQRHNLLVSLLPHS